MKKRLATSSQPIRESAQERERKEREVVRELRHAFFILKHYDTITREPITPLRKRPTARPNKLQREEKNNAMDMLIKDKLNNKTSLQDENEKLKDQLLAPYRQSVEHLQPALP